MTSIEWLEQEIKHIIPNDFLHKFQEAKEMERKQIIDAFQSGDYGNIRNAVIYYNETYGSKGNDETSDFEKPFMDFAKQYFKPKKD